MDNFRTPHTEQLHVVQRFRMIDDGKMLEVNVHVDDPGAFTTPWDAIQRYRRTEGSPMPEETCAEGARDYFNQGDAEPIPQAAKPDFDWHGNLKRKASRRRANSQKLACPQSDLSVLRCRIYLGFGAGKFEPFEHRLPIGHDQGVVKTFSSSTVT